MMTIKHHKFLFLLFEKTNKSTQIIEIKRTTVHIIQ